MSGETAPIREARLVFTAPLRLAGGLNAREHWRKRAKRVGAERNATTFAALAALGRDWQRAVSFPCVVTITRRGPRLLDDDNLPGSCKAVRDQIAAELGITDGPTDKRASWAYAQEKGAYGVTVEIACEDALRGLGLMP